MRDPLQEEPQEFTEVDVDGNDIVYVPSMSMEKISRGASYDNGIDCRVQPTSNTRVSDSVNTADIFGGFRTVRNL